MAPEGISDLRDKERVTRFPPFPVKRHSRSPSLSSPAVALCSLSILIPAQAGLTGDPSQALGAKRRDRQRGASHSNLKAYLPKNDGAFVSPGKEALLSFQRIPSTI